MTTKIGASCSVENTRTNKKRSRASVPLSPPRPSFVGLSADGDRCALPGPVTSEERARNGKKARGDAASPGEGKSRNGGPIFRIAASWSEERGGARHICGWERRSAARAAPLRVREARIARPSAS
ncbi:hypothetical protein HPB50_026483 [Hyalomma asiaticum]|uniref:Uncharacterized protein n=1 Tax=Hyalomma asiaticum TaxID=266040 RepID=A0ACB7SR00_HYAAI|nr:hypothetical protein HPB50_026483 [Hyalomma asiaticum]